MGSKNGVLKLFSVVAVVVAMAIYLNPAVAAVGTFGSYIGINDGSGSGNVWYGGSQPGPTSLESFHNKWLGDYTIGDPLLISGAELLTWKNGGGDVTGAKIHFSIYETTASPVTWNTTAVGFTSNVPFNDAAGNPFSNGGDQKWADIAAQPDVLYGVGNGLYHLAIYFEADTNEGARYDNNGGSNYVASFRVGPGPAISPEPSTFLILAGGLLPLAALFRRRRR